MPKDSSPVNAKAAGSSHKLIVNGYYFSGSFGLEGEKGQSYIVLQGSITNYSDSTLKYWATNCRFTELFNVTGSQKLVLTNEEAKSPVFKEITIAPHRSQKVLLTLSEKEPPNSVFILTVSMRLYKSLGTGSFEADKKNQQAELLSDDITLRFTKNGNQYSDEFARVEKDKKDKLNLPSMDLYLLTDIDRKFITVSIDASKISKPVNSSYPVRNGGNKSVKLINIPVIVHNNSNDTLKYPSMSCSWVDYYRIDNQFINITFDGCDKNIPIEIKLPPHGTDTKVLSVVYDPKQIKGSQKIEIGVNINKGTNVNIFEFNSDVLSKYNLVWSNEITVPVN
ncbi:MAG: hypothetical protein ABJA76_15775 [Mucilaginibacter sp.]